VRLLHILNSIEFSGAETMLAASAGDFAAEGFEVVCLSTGAAVGPYAPVLREHGVGVEHIPYRGSPAFWWDVYRYLRRSRFEVVHVHSERGTFRYGLAARLAGAHVIVRTVHSVFTPTGWRAVARGALRRLAVRWPGVEFVFIGESVADNERARFGTKGRTITNFVDERRFFPAGDKQRSEARERLGVPESEFAVAVVGSCLPVKQHSDVIEALALIGAPVWCLHAGSGPLEDAETARAAELGIRDRVRFLGSVEDVRAVYIASDCLVMPSEHEGLGMAVIEAAACGVPTIAFDVSGLRDIIANGRTGLLLQEKTAPSLARALETAAARPAELANMGSRAREAAAVRYSRSDWMTGHLSLYRTSRGEA
jgi:glycosyltransferase involved in cell wall biosynthesis